MSADLLADYGRCPNRCGERMVDRPEGGQVCPSCGLVAVVSVLDMDQPAAHHTAAPCAPCERATSLVTPSPEAAS